MKQKSKIAYLLLAGIMMATFISGCGKSSSSGSSGPTPYPQNVLDSDVVWQIGSGVGTIYNQNLAGHPVGNQNIPSASCPLGGTVAITGTTGYGSNNSITTVNLTYNMTNCRISGTGSATGSGVMLTLTGTLTYTGSFASGYTSTNFQSTSLRMDGVATRSAYTDGIIAQDCSVSGTNNGTAIYGLICGRTY